MATRRYKRSSTAIATFLRWFSSPRIRYRALFAIGVLFLWGAGTVLWWSRDLPDPQNIRESQFTESTKIFDASGTRLLYEIGEARRTWVELDRMSPQIVGATLAAEDDQFYEHHGIDIRGIIRAAFSNLLNLDLTGQGGSTITQQLIKNSVLTPERTYQRKVKEAVLALELEQRFTKDEILTMYLNAIPYGSRSFGVEAAAQTFFATSATDVSLAQAAILAAVSNAPTYYSPYGSHFEDLKMRQEHILTRMAQLGMVSAAEAEAAKQEELVFQPATEAIQAPHFVFYVKEQLDEQYGEGVVEQGGLKVVTTLDMDLQEIAEEVLQENEQRLKGLGASNAALVAIDPRTGNILAMAGSLDYFNDEIDGNVNVAIRHRSPGSSFKPFVYTAAFAKGFTPETILVDAETDFGQDYKPKNYDLREHGPITMRVALANSLNIPAVKALYLVGVKEATDLAQAMGMESLNDPDRYGLSLVLGGGEVRLLDLVSGYGVFAAEGTRHPHRAVLKVENREEVIFDITEKEPDADQVLDAQVARLTTDVLSDNGARALSFGTGSYLQLGSRPVAAKTGTTQEYRDGWTIGFTPSLAAGVWSGNNDNSPMGDRSPGANTAAPIWNAFMRRALEGKPIEQFTRPEPIRDVRHSLLRGELPEVKGKWVEETKTFYTANCPIAIGEPRTFKELHSLLFSVRRTNPQGPPPARAEADPQFANWEAGVAAWRSKHREENRSKPEEPIYTDSLPTPSCNVGSEEDLPKVRIIEPGGATLTESPVSVTVEVDSPHPLKEVRFLLDSQELARRGPDEPFSFSFSFSPETRGRRVLQVLAITENDLIGRANRTFVINPDETPPTLTLHTPTDGATVTPSQFPHTVKITATDESGIELVDALYRKVGENSTHRIAQTNKTVPIAPNRYDVTWDDSPGPGEWEVFAIAYDKTGNSTESPHHRIVIE